MKARTDNANSIRRQLLVTLFVPAAIVLIAATATDYLTALPPYNDAFDQALLDSALVIAAHVRPDENGQLELSLPPDALAVLRADSKDSIYFRVSATDGSFVAGDVDLPDLPRPQSRFMPSQLTAEYRGVPVRLVAYRTFAGNKRITVTMGETTNKRDQMRERTLTTALATDFIVLSLILALIWFSVRWSLKPLRQVEDQISQRSPRNLTPLAVGSVPVEIQGLMKALNQLFVLVSDNASSQRQFLDNAAHQLRTPLTGIQAQLELMCATEEDEPRRQRLQRILDGARRLGQTTHQLLTLARADESASPNLPFEDVQLRSIVESAVADNLAAAARAGIDLGADTEAASIRGVDWLLVEALKSLANNALAHTPAGGSVTLGCGIRGGAPYLEVVDTGIGIPEVERPRVFERFFRASNSRGAGSGLGLAIVKDVTELHGGTLAIEVGPGGVGTVARIVFPLDGQGRAARDGDPASRNAVTGT